jgi:hypothetical protein
MRKHARQRPRKIQEHRQTGQHSFEDGYAPSLPWDHECRRSQGVTPGDQMSLINLTFPHGQTLEEASGFGLRCGSILRQSMRRATSRSWAGCSAVRSARD